jgi:hypothetical protein
MKNNIRLVLECLLMSILLISGCRQHKYADAVQANEQYINLVETYVADMEKAGDAKDVARAMNQFADGMEKLFPKMRKIAEKYPELKDRDDIPPELKDLQQRAQAVAAKMGGAMIKVGPYMNDPEVQKAQKHFQEVMVNANK